MDIVGNPWLITLYSLPVGQLKQCKMHSFRSRWLLMRYLEVVVTTQEEFEDTKGVIKIRISKTTQWPKEKVQKDKQRSTKHTHKTKDRVTRTPLKMGVERRCSGRVSSSWSSCGIRRVNLAKKNSDKSWISKELGSVYDKWNISMIICDTDIP